MEVSEDQVFGRWSCDFEDFKRFEVTESPVDRQYSSVYLARLAALRNVVEERAKSKWPGFEVIGFSDLVERDEHRPCIVVGTLYKHQEFKPSILRELSEELQLLPQPAPSNYASRKDAVFLEDETLRVRLGGDCLNAEEAVTGLVCGVLGHAMENGVFLVTDWCFPGPPPARPLRRPKPGKVLLISGLDFANAPCSIAMNLLSEWLSGMAGLEESQEEVASVVCVIIAGNSVRGSVETQIHRGYLQNKVHDAAAFKESAASARRLDEFLVELARNCRIVLMPGEFDPVNYCLPQQAFHPCVLPATARYKSLHGATNPWIGSVNDRIVAGSSGRPIQNILKVAGLAEVSPLTWLERTLTWRHFAPTAPDTLPSFPFFEKDPFVMEERPDLYFAGNMEKFDTKLIEGEDRPIRLVCVPKFSETQTGVVVDLLSLDASTISFGVG